MSVCPPGALCRIQLLGPPSIWTSTGRLSATKPLVFGAALYLGLHRGQPVSRTGLAALLWPDVHSTTRAERMRWLMTQLRQAGIPTPAGSSVMELHVADVSLDVDDFERAATAAEALALERGTILAGYEPAISDAFSRWVDERRDALRGRLLATLGRWLDASRREARWPLVEEVARQMIQHDELHEGATLALAESLAMQGRHERATELVARYRGEVGTGATTPAVHYLQQQLNAPHPVNESERDRQPIVGREQVIAQLLDSVDPHRATHSCIAIAGPSGIGKSRTLLEFTTVAALRGIRVVRLACANADALRPISLVVDLARALLGMRGSLGAAPESIEVLRRLLGERAQQDDERPPDLRRAEVYAALGDLLAALCEDGPLAIVADDVQWAEPGSWAVIGPLVGEHPEVSWIFSLRCDTAAAAAQLHRTMLGGEHPTGDLLWLSPLGPVDVAALCTAQAAPRQLPSETMAMLIERAAGIPFVAEALVRHWCDVGELVSLPPSVSRLVAARLDRLSPAATRIVEGIALLGTDADASAIEAVTLLDRGALLEGTRELDSAGILRASDGGQLSAHALWTEAAVARVPAATLAIQHRYAAEWLEHVAGLAAVPDHRRHWAIANHWLGAGDPERARIALDRAADVLLANGFTEHAASMLERAGDLAGVSPTALHYWERAGDVWYLENSKRATERVIEIRDRYDVVARELYGLAYSPHHTLELNALYLMARVGWSSAEHGVRLAQCVLDPTASVQHRLDAAESALKRAYAVTDRALLDRVWNIVAALEPSTELEMLRREACATIYYLRVAEDTTMALRHALRAREVVRRNPSFTKTELLRILENLAFAYEYDGDLDGAQAVRLEAFGIARAVRSPGYMYMTLTHLVGTALEAGRLTEIRTLVLVRVPSNPYVNRAITICRAVFALEQRDLAAARAEVDFTASEALAMQESMPRARAVAILAHIALLEGDELMMRRLLPPLLECFEGRMGYMDHPAYVAGMCLARLQGASPAAAFVKRFLTEHRAERWTPRDELLFLAGETSPARAAANPSRAAATGSR